jgi:hypothetical protein
MNETFEQHVASLFERGYGEVRFALVQDCNGVALMQIDPEPGNRYYLTGNTISRETIIGRREAFAAENAEEVAKCETCVLKKAPYP